MDYDATTKCFTMRLGLSSEELNMPAIDDLFDQVLAWQALIVDGAHTRAASRRIDNLYNTIMSTELPTEINLRPLPTSTRIVNGTNSNGFQNTSNQLSEDSLDTDVNISRYMTGLSMNYETQSNPNSEGETRPNTRQRSRQQVVRTPMSNGRLRPRMVAASPMTPTGQQLRPFTRSQPSGSGDSSNGSSIINAALNQQHPSLQMHKTRQLLNTRKQLDSAQKRRQELEDRKRAMLQEKMDSLARAEAQREHIKAERAQQARQRREERTRKVADVRAQQSAKARETPKPQQKTQPTPHEKPQPPTSQEKPQPPPTQEKAQPPPQEKPQPTTQEKPQSQPKEKPQSQPKEKPQQPPHEKSQPRPPQQITAPQPLNSTYEKVVDQADNNISIQIADEDCTMDESPKKAQKLASWARAPHFREAIIAQFSENTDWLRKCIFPPMTYPIDLEGVFGPRNAVIEKYARRTSSAIWSPPPNRALKRSSSAVFTPDR